jgi:formylglycine-generating enzyme required for sulfatase activity
VQLPTEAEWEASAAYDAQMQRRTYAWGEEEPTPEHAIFKDDQGNNLGAPAPVGVCSAGMAACGALDMGGQVWELCTNSYGTYPRGAEDACSEFNQGERYVPLRGGSWYNNKPSVRTMARVRYYPNVGGTYYGGFRVLLAHHASS